ncbi:chromosome segregation protein SMC [Microbacterium aurantiacum]|uniref:Chromosome partition protein Smc n=1 Tax=Microbacterium aurantiacum TaxID=162393 RepID=A0ABT8FRA8_9MICO|nr:chromosome segregation protein SMC [Microbacterium aurantiacum]MDN4463804.1 chromosome segregation protein SMC [Microbacterium aurantiacum]
MHLKSLTLKGFKSFAQPTTFALEPGVTCIVGPNGSGKSNVVDALAWVMGEQGAKTLRGGKMEDVIFAGTSTRGPLGRAEVQLTIDNGDGALPIEYSEVTISRTLFRNGSSEYAINGQSCRLLDVQELLSDSGLGREMHVIVGQGRLDSVLQATPEDRRGFIEEAAGILKHRRRKEKTLRKLDAMEANLTRVNDLAGELRRQLKPLGRQADVAREAAGIAAEVRDAKARLMADDLLRVRTVLADAARGEQETHAERAGLQARLDDIRGRIEQLESDQRSEAVDEARRVASGLERVQERTRGLYALVGQRLTLLGSAEDDERVEVATVSPQMIDAARAEIAEVTDGLQGAQDAAEAAARDVTRARAELDALDADIAAQSALVSSHDMRLTALRGTAEAADSALAAVRAAVERQQRALDAAHARRTEAEEALADLGPAPDPQADAADAQAAYERAQRDASSAEAQVADLRERLHAAERERDALMAQVTALGRALEGRSAAAGLLDGDRAGVRGLVSDAVQVEFGWEAAIAAALGSYAEGVVADADRAFALADAARAEDLGRVDIVFADAVAHDRPAPPDGLRSAIEVVDGPAGVRALLASVFLAEDLDQARAAATALSTGRIVTRSGEVLTPFSLRSGAGGSRSRLELTAERDAAAIRRDEIVVFADALREALREAQDALRGAKSRANTALTALRDHDAAAAARAEKSNRATVRHEAAVAECDRLAAGLAQASAAVAEAEDAARVAHEQFATAQEAPRPILDASSRDDVLGSLETARDVEMRARLEVETLRERIRAAEARVAGLERQRERERAAAEESARRAVIRRAQREKASAVAERLPPLIDAIDRSLADARAALLAAQTERAAVTEELATLRRNETEVRERLSRLTENVHALELRIHENRLHATALRERAASELGLEEDILLKEYGPGFGGADGTGASSFDRGAEQKRLQAAERKLAQLGRVNPLALEEFAALEQRHAFLTEQLADLTQTRKDLLTIIEELDERMQVIFLAAFEDTRVAFGEVFPILFPGGTGSIALTDPDSPLTTGIEVSVRPVGKKIERLSLLSGGERSLAAVALLTAIFKARPSPFYILDEVEAALDDANLGRLLGVFEQLRSSSQLIVITHQKRTMEIADALYGVSMRQDGVSAVVGQRVRESAPA